MRRMTITLRALVPDGASKKEIREYITDALGSWCGSLQPPGVDEGGVNPDAEGDPMWGGIKVQHISLDPKARAAAHTSRDSEDSEDST